MALPSSINQRGLRSAQPVATAVAAGTIYFVTDENVTEQSNGSAWVAYSRTNAYTAAGILIGTVKILAGTGSPQGAVAAAVGSLFLRTDGGTSTTLYVKETGTTTSSGWVAK